MAFVPFVETDQPTMAAFNEKFQQNFEAAVNAGVQIAVGDYVGTGESSKSLVLGFIPYLVIVGGDYGYPEDTVSMVRGSAYARHYAGSNAGGVVAVSWNEKMVSWTAYDESEAFNSPGKQYRYVAIGRKEE